MFMITMIVLLGVIALAILWFIAGYNSFARLDQLVQEGWSGVDVQLKRRYDLIPNLVATVKGYSFHEKDVLENVVRLRAASMGATSIQEKEKAEAGLTQSLKTLFAVSEQYPDLKANQNFLSLQNELSVLEQELQLARRYYNGTVRNYNSAIVIFPGSLIARVCSFTKYSYFELNSPAERETPTVKF